jgi:hypothetical protein
MTKDVLKKLAEVTEELGLYAQPTQELEACCAECGKKQSDGWFLYCVECVDDTPAQKPWVGLTAQEAAECWTTNATQTWKNFEAKLKEKNT